MPCDTIAGIFGLLSFSRNREYLMPSPKGYEFFSGAGFACAPPAKRPYAQSPALRRRLEVGAILLTTLAAGIEPACNQVPYSMVSSKWSSLTSGLGKRATR